MTIKFYSMLRTILNTSKIEIEFNGKIDLEHLMYLLSLKLDKKIFISSKSDSLLTLNISSSVGTQTFYATYSVRVVNNGKIVGFEDFIADGIVEVFPLMGGG